MATDAMSEEHPGLMNSEALMLGHAKMVIAHYGFTERPGYMDYWTLTAGNLTALITPEAKRDLVGHTLSVTLRTGILSERGTEVWETFDASTQPAEAARWCRERLGLDALPVPGAEDSGEAER